MRWNLILFGTAVIASGYTAAAIARIALRTLWPDVIGVYPLYGIAIGAVVLLVGLTWAEGPGLVTAAAGAGLAAASGMLLIAGYTGHANVFLYAWALVPATASVAVLVFGQIHNDPALSDRAFKAYTYSIVAFLVCGGATVATVALQGWVRTTQFYGSLTWVAAAVGLVIVVVAITSAIRSGRRRRAR